MPVFPVEGLYRGGIVQKRHHFIAVLSGLALLHDHLVPVKNPRVYHTVPFDVQNENLSVGEKFRGNGEIVLHILDGQNGLSGSHPAHDGNIHHLPAGQIKIVVHDLDGTGLCGIPADVAVLLQRLQMRMYRGGGLEIYRLTDLADCRGKSPVQDLVLYIIQNLLLFFADFSVCHMSNLPNFAKYAFPLFCLSYHR